ncbi:MAG: GMC family oxidoreductase N-terminal domain-containing protein [Proteobacteria bacterium]|nr:GMC family oxidoreductase N-terminal domain-containing protein [Pseudomonadota bacterium]
MNSTQAKYDAIVVGSGPGGATVAKELTNNNKKVLILEWGSNAPIKGSLTQLALNGGIPGKNLLITDMKGMAMVRGTCTGGSSVFYCGTAFDPPYDMMKTYGIDLENEVADLKKEIPIAPLKDDLMGQGAKMMMNSALDLGYDWHKFNKFIYQDKCELNCAKCSYGCPKGAKWTARNFVEEATDKGAKLINGAKVTKVIFENDKAVGVEYKKNLKTESAFADKIIIAAGGVGSPVILRHSGVYDSGYDFFYDPLIMVFGSVNGLKSNGEVQMSAGIHMKDEGYVMVDLNFPTPIFLGLTAPKLKFHKAFSQPKTLMLMIKIKDDLGGRITWNGGVRKSINKDDKQKLQKGYDRAKKILENAGAKGVYSGWTVAAHPGGTAKINHVVDSNLKTEKDNLYVCDCSVIPEAWGLPPTLTLLALGKRLAKHLA